MLRDCCRKLLVTPVTDAQPPVRLALKSVRFWAEFVDAFHVDGASITVFDTGGRQSTLGTSGPIAARAESLQFELGEGPHWEALATGKPVLCCDVLDVTTARWPAFSLAVYEIGIRSVFAFPMMLGGAILGVVDLHCLSPRRFDDQQVRMASAMANRIAMPAAWLGIRQARYPGSNQNELAPQVRREVHQATGMIQAQLDISATDAILRLRSHAFASGMPISTVADAVVARDLDFSVLPNERW